MVFLWVFRFSPSTKTSISKFQFDQDRETARKPDKAYVTSSLNIVKILYLRSLLSHLFSIFVQVSKLKGHWENIVENSTVWRGQIDYLMEEWKRFVELREELLEWIRKAEAYLEKDENVYGFTVSELEEQIDKHKVRCY